MSNVIHLAGRTRRRGVDIHVDTNPPWECITFADTDGEPILSYDPWGWVLYYFGDDPDCIETYETGVTAPPHIHKQLRRYADQDGAWNEFVTWAQSNPRELEWALSASRAHLESSNV